MIKRGNMRKRRNFAEEEKTRMKRRKYDEMGEI